MEALRPGPLNPTPDAEPFQQPLQIAGMDKVGFTLVEVDSQPVHIPLSGTLIVLPEKGVHTNGWLPLQVPPHGILVRLTDSGVRLTPFVDQRTDTVVVDGYTATLVQAGEGIDYIIHRSSEGMSDS